MLVGDLVSEKGVEEARDKFVCGDGGDSEELHMRRPAVDL